MHTQGSRNDNEKELAQDGSEHIDAAHGGTHAANGLEVDGEEVATAGGGEGEEAEVEARGPDDATPYDGARDHGLVADAVLPEHEEHSCDPGSGKQPNHTPRAPSYRRLRPELQRHQEHDGRRREQRKPRQVEPWYQLPQESPGEGLLRDLVRYVDKDEQERR